MNIQLNQEFETENDFQNYIEQIKQKLDNLRVIETYEILTDLILEENYFVNLIIKTVDTKNFIALPYPKYDSNEGFVAKIKLRDSNLFGTISVLDAELLYAYTEKSLRFPVDNVDNFVYNSKTLKFSHFLMWITLSKTCNILEEIF